MICINKGQNQYEVVDGQQRLTTLSIIVSELKKIIPIQGIKDDLQKRVLPIDVYSDETDEPRLIVRKKSMIFINIIYCRILKIINLKSHRILS
ncbi:hypothetical protein BANRA_00362 [Escherichia coli]|nr:hypothetical protein BANRA_00362 [Escherichia coli]